MNNLIEYPFPLRHDCIVKLVLPSDLKLVEVARLTQFMEALVLSIYGISRPEEKK